jgi:hypothetical protein
MDYPAFLKLAKEKCQIADSPIRGYNCYLDNIPENSFYGLAETGGVNGGSCWKESDPQPYSRKLDTDAVSLSDMFDMICEILPKVNYSTIRQITKAIKEKELIDVEWYGNNTEYLARLIHVHEVFNILYGCEPDFAEL